MTSTPDNVSLCGIPLYPISERMSNISSFISSSFTSASLVALHNYKLRYTVIKAFEIYVLRAEFRLLLISQHALRDLALISYSN
jgi:hypothetical protein